MIGEKITVGFNHNFFQKVTITTTEFAELADVVLNFKYQSSFTLANEGNVVVEYSFNGTDLAGDMTPGKASEALAFDNRRISKIWFRLASPGSSIVRVEAWSSI